MKNILALIAICIATIGYSQDIKPTFTVEGDLVKAIYYNEDGSINTQGYFKNKKLTGEWIKFDKEGNKTQIAKYENGKKVGKWFFWDKESLKEVNYDNNVIVNVSLWKQESYYAANE
ncbi:nicotinic acid mononucleotide adenyltransferase [Polaribacter sp. Asnod1-A03]|uniref:nicotinic acid mononucleotide adenyltransferase n=1 Tax=Polaribacter sp. Asnod1-A03 TaxID=3160581 RepID=UPI003866FC1D